MQDLNVTWKQVETCLAEIPGVKPAAFKKQFFDRGMFYRIRYDPGEIVMAEGMYSDYAGVLMSGQVRVLVGELQLASVEADVPDCWRRPGKVFRCVEQWVLARTDRYKAALDAYSERKNPNPQDLSPPKLRLSRLAEWIRNTEWFRRGHERFRMADRKLAAPLERSIHNRAWRDKVKASEIIISARISDEKLESIIKRFMGVTGATWNQPRGATLVADPDERQPPCEMILMNRKALLQIAEQSKEFQQKQKDDFVNQVLPRMLQKNLLFTDLHVSDVILADLAKGADLQLLPFAKGNVIVRQDDQADSLGLILNGTVRISRELPGGASLVEHKNERDYFGVACVQEGQKRGASVTAVTDVNVVTVSRQVLREHFFSKIPGLEPKLIDQWKRLQQENREADELRRTPRGDPPEHLVPKLMQARNLLRINMDLCTRCDQCVKACAETHDGVSRFHRANADLRFGKWEIAAACVHCINAPCQKACPVGAITFLPDGMVQIHRSRCISCESCVDPCPFNVIEMLPPTSPEEAPMASAKKRGFDAVATKCDLCLTKRGEPPCVNACPYGAAERGAPGELFPGLEHWLEFSQPQEQ